MGFEQYGGYGRIGYEVTDHWNLRADVNVTHFNASYPGPVSAPLLDGDQHITRGMTSFAVENEYGKTSGALSFFYNWGDHWINDGYTPSAGEGPPDRARRHDDRRERLDGGQRLAFADACPFPVGRRGCLLRKIHPEAYGREAALR